MPAPPSVADALAGAARVTPAARAARRRVLVAGGGGVLGAAVVEALLAAHRFERVGVLVAQPIYVGVRAFAPVADDDPALSAFAADTALVVFDRARAAASGREDVFARPAPAALPALAQRLHAAGVRRAVVVVPHRPALLPQALQRGLASLDEAAVAALGFEQLVFMRMAQDAGPVERLRSAPQRLARWMLSQLHWMVPAREQPVRAATVARVAAAIALALPETSPGTRVLPAALLWQAAQHADATTLIQAWLGGRA